jgi:hypothetical protein
MPQYSWETFKNSMPTFVVYHPSIDSDTGRQIDWSRVPDTYRMGTSYTVKANGAAAAAATSITVDALPVDLPVGQRLDFTGSGEFAILTAPALEGDTTISVEALDAGVEDNDEATVLVSHSGKKFIPAGTAMVIYAANKMMVPRAARPGSETAFCLLASNAIEDAPHNAMSGFGCIIGGAVYQNLLPDFANAAWATFKTELNTAGVGTGFAWITYEDSRAD